jgi:hypothetical protein
VGLWSCIRIEIQFKLMLRNRYKLRRRLVIYHLTLQLLDEMDRIMKSTTCADMRERWRNIVPHILSAAYNSKSQNVKEIIAYNQPLDSFGKLSVLCLLRYLIDI